MSALVVLRERDRPGREREGVVGEAGTITAQCMRCVDSLIDSFTCMVSCMDVL